MSGQAGLSDEKEPTLAEALALLDDYLGMVEDYHADALADALAHRISTGGASSVSPKKGATR